MASAGVEATQPINNNMEAHFGISSVSTSFSEDSVAFKLNVTGVASSAISVPVSIQRVFSIGSAGSHTFYFLARRDIGMFAILESHLTLLFVPTAYGTVATSSAEAAMRF
jgi:hypothetical protein